MITLAFIPIFIISARLGWYIGSQPWIKRGNCSQCGRKLSPYTHPDLDPPRRLFRYCLKPSCFGKEYCGPDEKPNYL